MDLPLNRLEVLLLDCQTTGSNPRKGHLLEVAWYLYRPERGEPSEEAVKSALVELPRGVEIPRQISRMTGIDGQLMKRAVHRREVWASVVNAGAPAVPDASEGSRPGRARFAVAHFARFEREFLTHLQAEVDPDRPFPYQFVCTHELARRLLPSLPRRGLRALAGYFGKPLSETKRASSHVLATAQIWRSMIDLLRKERGIDSIRELREFLDAPVPAGGRRKWSYPLPREKRLALPDKPGVYRFLSGGGEILYIGKAASLKTRVNSYFRKRRAEDKMLELVSQARDVDVTITGCAVEAALLEAEEIRRLAPAYNIALRDRGQEVWFSSRDMKSTASESDEHDLLEYSALLHQDDPSDYIKNTLVEWYIQLFLL